MQSAITSEKPSPETQGRGNSSEKTRALDVGISIIECSSLSEAVEVVHRYMDKKIPGILLTDIDDTLFNSTISGLRGQPERLSKSALELFALFGAHANATEGEIPLWKAAVVTNMPDRGHQISSILSKRARYQDAFTHFKQKGIRVFGMKLTRAKARGLFLPVCFAG